MTIDHDAIAARVRQDRKAGTPGKWIADPHDAEADQDRYDTVFADAGIHGASPLAFIPHFWSAHWVDACRIAGLPRLEAAYLDLYDEVKRLRADRKQGGLDYCDLMERHDAHFVAWQSAKSRAEKAEAERDALRAALVEHNDLLRSASQIAKREGIDGEIASTNWDAYYNRVAVVLKRHHDLCNEARQALKGHNQ